MERKFVITIGRQLGSGGRIIGEKLAAKLGIAFYDKELIQMASQESGLGKEFFEQADEKKLYSVFGGLFGLRGTIADEPFSTYYLNNETLFKIQSDVIRNIAEKESAIFIGRCADYVLRDNPRCVNIFISAKEEYRCERLMQSNGISKDAALEMIEKADKKRAAYYNYYSYKTWGAAASYHLCIDSSVLGIDGTIKFIKEFVKLKVGL